tara:strand:- start:38 stop:496 length:459 start_codon:yes stop_codon:yes gene_type:complete
MKMEKSNRLNRELETRETAERPKQWMPPQLLPDPSPEPGYAFRWIRISTLNKEDAINVSSKLREGWEPVKASDHPEIRLFGTTEGQFPDSVVVGGLMLCKTPVEFTVQRDAYYRKQAESQMQAVDNTFMRENDPRMPMFKERRSEVTFGRGN